MTEEQQKRQAFVKEYLERVVCAVGDISACTYLVENKEEYIEIEYFNGYKPRINVTADSIAALVYDVFKYIKNH